MREQPDGFRVDAVLFDLNARVEGLGCIVLEDGDARLQDDGAGVGTFIDKVDCATGDLGTIVEGLFPASDAREGWQEGGVDVEDAPLKVVQEGGLHDAHVACQDNDVDLEGVEVRKDALLSIGIQFGPVGGMVDPRGGDVVAGRTLENASIGDIGDDAGDFGVEGSRVNGILDGLHIAAGARAEDSNAEVLSAHR